MIPKKIHYCWFGGNPLPEQALECIASWKRYCPDYEIIEWNESNFNVHICDYVKEAYEAKKWAFVSDYARFWILYHYGGIYFDTDVEIIKDISDIIKAGSFMGCEPSGKKKCRIASGLALGSEAGDEFYREILNYYKSIHFIISQGVLNEKTVVTHITELAKQYGFVGNRSIEEVKGILVYPPEYFCPMDCDTGIMSISEQTRAIHWYGGSWKTVREMEIHRRKVRIYKKFPNGIGKGIASTYEWGAKIIYYLVQEGPIHLMRRIQGRIKRGFR